MQYFHHYLAKLNRHLCLTTTLVVELIRWMLPKWKRNTLLHVAAEEEHEHQRKRKSYVRCISDVKCVRKRQEASGTTVSVRLRQKRNLNFCAWRKPTLLTLPDATRRMCRSKMRLTHIFVFADEWGGHNQLSGSFLDTGPILTQWMIPMTRLYIKWLWIAIWQRLKN